MERVTEAFTWPFRDPEWLSKLLIIGLTLLIPIVGAINGLGWMLATIDRLRTGEERMAPANLSYLGRGIRLFAVELIYAAGIVLLALLIYIPALALAIQQGRGSANPALISLAVVLLLLSFSVTTLASVALNFLMPSIVLATDRGGIGAGIQVGAMVRHSRINLTTTLIAGLMLIAAGFMGSLGVIACGIGGFLTAAYGLAMQAWVIRSFENGSDAAAAA